MNYRDLLFFKSSTYERIQDYLNNLGDGNYIPHPDLIFRALELTPLDKAKVVIIGQDPYHTPNTANGLAFSVSAATRYLPPSLRNIYRELVDDLGVPYPRNGDLTPWAQRGVLLINSCLTCEAGMPRAHRDIGWDVLVDEVVVTLATQKRPVVFILWGRDAQEREESINTGSEYKNLVIKSPHPSPYSAATGFYGSKPFSKANEFLRANNVTPVDWRL